MTIRPQILNAIAVLEDTAAVNQFFDGVHTIIKSLGITAEDKRLALTAPKNTGDLRVNINGRLVYALSGLTDGGFRWLFMLRSADYEQLQEGCVVDPNMRFAGKDDMLCVEAYTTDMPEQSYETLFRLCLEACREYLPTESGSRFRSNHLPELFELAVDNSLRNDAVETALNMYSDTLFEKAIAAYKDKIRADNNEPERYKWVCTQTFRRAWDIDAPDFEAMLKAAISDRQNLMHQISSGFILKAAKHFPEEVRQMFRRLLEEGEALTTRLRTFNKAAEDLQPRVQQANGGTINHQQDERTMSFYLAMRYPEKYPLYKRDIYVSLFNMVGESGDEQRPAGERFLHFMELGRTVLPVVAQDEKLQELVAATLTDKCWKGDQQWLIFQDILWRAKGDSTEIIGDGAVVTDATDTPFHKQDMKHPLNQILYGPPGTGKTYSSITYALSVIEGKEVTAYKVENRADVKKRFDDLLIKDWGNPEGQIGFLTFHQSLSYEDFIEGIKPITADEDDGRLRYEIQDGIFKRICAVSESPSGHDFDAAYGSLQKELVELGDQQLTLKTPTGKPFGITLNGRGNLNIYTAGNREKAVGTLVKGGLQRQIKSGDYYKWWLGYFNAVINHLKEKHGYRELNSGGNQKPSVLIIDEINRGNVSQIFGELITLIEESKRSGASEALSVTLPYSRESFSVPPNLYIIGTMNTADRSVEALDTALRRRFSFVEMMPDYDTLRGKDIDGLSLEGLLRTINERIAWLKDRDHQIGHAFLLKVETANDLRDAFTASILPLLQEYFYNDYSSIRLILGDAFVEKVTTPSFAVRNGLSNQPAAYRLRKLPPDVDIVQALKASIGTTPGPDEDGNE